MVAERDIIPSTAKERIVATAAELLASGGREALSTRAVSAAAGVQAPTIYRLFGDMQGLLDAVASFGFETYVNGKISVEPCIDPVQRLRAGWDTHVAFGLANPALYSLMYGEFRPGTWSPAAAAAAAVLYEHVRIIAEAGRLRVTETRAAQLVHSAGCGTTLTLIALPKNLRDLALSETAREAVIAAITTDASIVAVSGPVAAAIHLRAVLPQAAGLSKHERALLKEWLDRIAAAG